MKALGIVLALVGLALTAYSIMFVTWVAFGFFLLGIGMTVTGVRLAVRRGRSASN